MSDLGERVSKVETVLPTLATKTDLLELKLELKEEIDALRVEMHKDSLHVSERLESSRTEMYKETGILRTEAGNFRVEMHKEFRRIEEQFGKIKEEFALVRKEIAETAHKQTWTIILFVTTFVSTFCTGLVAAVYYIARNIH